MKTSVTFLILLFILLTTLPAKSEGWKDELVNNDAYSRNTITWKCKESGFNLLKVGEVSIEGTSDLDRINALNFEIIKLYRLYPMLRLSLFIVYDVGDYVNKPLTWILTQKSPDKSSTHLGLTLEPSVGVEKVR